MWRGIASLQFCALLVAVAGEAPGCTVDATGKNVCPEYQDDRTALLQNKVTVAPEGHEDPIAEVQVGESDDATTESEGEEDAEESESADADEEGAEEDEASEERIAQALLAAVKKGNLSHSTKGRTKLQNAMASVIDVDELVENQTLEAYQNWVDLKAKVNGMRSEVNQAKTKFKSDRSKIRSNYKKCRKKIPLNKKKWKNKNECKPFKDFFGGVSSKCAKKGKCELRQAKRKAKKAAKEDFKAIRRTFRDFKKQRNKAFFQFTILPKIIMLLKPSLLSAMTQIDMGNGASGMLRDCTLESPDDCTPLDQIGTAELLKNYMELSLHKQLWPKLLKVFTKIKEKLWKFVKGVKDSVKTSLQASIGSIPVVGGGLSVAVGALIEALYFALKYYVNSKIKAVRELLQDTIVINVVDAVFATGLFTTENLQANNPQLASQMQSVADIAQQNTMTAAQSDITSEAANAEAAAIADAASAEDDIADEGDEVKDKDEEDEGEDEDAYAAEDAADVDDDDND
mmetsp:Transcript_81413/g.154551  ORF Transcript_81413/g.154551 Transcript_81413/m.154551 type:complete len:514 (+) Transcript_81413:91-1632(+)